MRKLYQSEWHGIPFSLFSKCSTEKIADADFYDSFYHKFFERHQSWQDLDASWVDKKTKIIELIQRKKPEKDANILSIGCGIGIIEKGLLDLGLPEFDIHEVSGNSLQWIKKIWNPKNIFVGWVPQCLPEGKKYNLIYVSTADYCFDADSWLSFLKTLKPLLTTNGKLIIISVTVDTLCSKQKLYGKLQNLKLLSLAKLRNKALQFWGYFRTPKEFNEAFNNAGYHQIDSGFIDSHTYWIEVTAKKD